MHYYSEPINQTFEGSVSKLLSENRRQLQISQHLLQLQRPAYDLERLPPKQNVLCDYVLQVGIFGRILQESDRGIWPTLTRNSFSLPCIPWLVVPLHHQNVSSIYYVAPITISLQSILPVSTDLKILNGDILVMLSKNEQKRACLIEFVPRVP